MPASDNPDFPKFAGSDDVRSGKARRKSGLEPMPIFDAASAITVPVEILKENYDELLRIIEANEWSLDEGLTTVLLAGLGLQKGLLHLSEVTGMVARGDAHAGKRVDDIVQELAAYHSMYSVMKFKAFKLYKLNQVLEFNNSGLRAQEEMWQEWADRMRSEARDPQRRAGQDARFALRVQARLGRCGWPAPAAGCVRLFEGERD